MYMKKIIRFQIEFGVTDYSGVCSFELESS
jgi:hypothetical protein